MFTIAVSGQEDSVSAFSRPEIEERHLYDPLKSLESEISFTYNAPMGISSAFTPFVLVGGHLFGNTEGHFTFNFEPQSNRFILYDSNNGLTNLCIGGMTNLVETNNWVPDIYIANNLFYPYQKFSSPDIKFLNWETIFFLQNIINRRLTVNYSVGYVYFNYYLKSSFEYSASVNYFLFPSLCLFSEHFGFFHAENNIFEPGFDFGWMYTHKKSQWDVCYARNYYEGLNLGYFSIAYSRNVSYKTTRKR